MKNDTRYHISSYRPDGSLVSRKELAAVLEGCRMTLELFKNMGRLVVESFRIEWCGSDEDSTRIGPKITVHFHDPHGRQEKHTSGFWIIGNGSNTPTAEDIVRHFCSSESLLLHKIYEHLGRGNAILGKESDEFARIFKDFRDLAQAGSLGAPTTPDVISIPGQLP